jgi:hypothetical protein
MGNNVRQLIFPFLDNANAVSNGNELLVGARMLTATIAVTGNAANFNIVVEAKANDTDDYTAISVVNLNTYAMSPNITANGKYSLPLEGYVRVRLRLSAIGAGAVTAKGTVTD